MMKKILTLISAICIAFISTVSAQCTDAPVINSFSPTTGFIGSTITISGAYFDATPANNIVYFGATKATVLTASFGTLTVTAPVGASTAPISVTNACKLTGYSKVSFNGIFCPTPINSNTYNNWTINLTGVYGAYNMLSQDFDLDGRPEIVTCYPGQGISVAKNGSTPGTLSFSVANFAGGGSYISTADFDGDGKRDLFTTENIYLNTSTGTGNFNFTKYTGYSGYQSNVGDFNNDGKIDLVYENTGGTMIFYRNTSTGPGNISFTYSTQISVTHRSTGIKCVDADGDGKTDVLSTQGNGNRLISIRNTTTPGASTFTFEGVEQWSTGGAYPYRCDIADFDKDGKIDVATVNYNNSVNNANTAVIRNNSTVGDIVFQNAITFPGPQNNYRIGVGDVNGDGLPDIVTKSLAVANFYVYPNTSSGAGTISFSSAFTYPAYTAEVSGIVIGDLDGDFVPDIATSGINSGRILVHRNTSAQQDVTNPTAACKNITVALSPSGNVTVTAAMIDNGSADACGISSLLINGNASKTFTCSNIGANTVTLTVVDKANNTATCTATVTVAAAAIIVSGQTTVCDGQTVLLTANVGDSYQWYKNNSVISGATNQTYTATVTGNYQVEVINAGGCSGTSSVTAVTVNTNPTVDISPANSAPLCNGAALLTASLSSVYQWKLNGNNISGATQQTYSATAVGTYSVKVIDIFGCTATSSGVTVTSTAPEIDITGNSNSIADGDNTPSTTDETDMGTTGSHVSTFTVNNSGSGNLNINSISIGGADPSYFTLGGITLPAVVGPSSSTTFTVTFSLATLTTKTATVTVNNNDCNEAAYDFALKGQLTCTMPAFTTCPSNQTESTITGTCAAEVTYSHAVTGTPTPSISYAFTGATIGNGNGNGSGSTFNKGVTTVTLSATNSCGTKTCSFDITVNDTEDPKISCPADINVNNDNGICGTKVTFNIPSVTDNCSTSGGSETFTYTGSSTTFKVPAGVSSITISATGAKGGGSKGGKGGKAEGTISVTSGESLVINVGGAGVLSDQITPNGGFNGGGGIFHAANGYWSSGTGGGASDVRQGGNALSNRVIVGAGGGGAGYADSGPGGSGGYNGTDGDPTNGGCNSTSSGKGATQSGGGAGGYCFTGCEGDVGTLGQGGNGDGCAASGGGGGGGYFGGGGGAHAAAGGGSNYVIGSASGVQHTTGAGSGNGTITISWSGFTASVAQTAGYASGSTFPVGTTTNTFLATDGSGNTSTCSFDVVVTDNEIPTIVFANNQSQTADAGVCKAAVSVTGPATSDNCAVATVVNDYNNTSDASGTYPVGTTTVIWTVTDIHGNTNTCTQLIKVTDNEIPTIVCANNQSQTADAGVCNAAVTVTGPATSDNCAVATVVNDYNNTSDASGTYPVGTTTVIWTVTDINGNTNTCTQLIKVTDNEKPKANCKNYTLNLSSGAGSITENDVNNGSTDNCGIATMTVSPSSFTCANAGANTVTLTVTDIHGNVSSCNATVTVQYQPSCTISVTPSNNTYTGGIATNIYLGYGPQSTTLTANTTGGSGFTYSWSPNTYLSATNVQSPVFTPTAEGNYSYTVTVTNSNGCKTTCKVSFCVKDVKVSGTSGNSAKVYLCHLPPGNNQNAQTLSISVNAVSSHIGNHTGDALGKCGATCYSNKRTVISELVVDIENLEITSSPNPFNNSFNVNYISSSNSEASIMVYGITGNLIEKIKVSGYSNQVELGSNLPAGIYTVSFTQDKIMRTFKMIKVN